MPAKVQEDKIKELKDCSCGPHSICAFPGCWQSEVIIPPRRRIPISVWSSSEGQRGHLKGASAKGAGARQDLRLSTHQFPNKAEPVCYLPQPLRQIQLLRSSKDQTKRQQHGPLLVTYQKAQIRYHAQVTYGRYGQGRGR